MKGRVIKISNGLVDYLLASKIHHRETYDDVIKRLIKQNQLKNSTTETDVQIVEN